jgi:DnaK suppressor protein
MDQASLAELRQQMLRRQEELRAESALAAESRSVVELDQSSVGRLSRMDALQVQEMALANDRRRQAELQRIEAALARMERGEYGDCVHCGEEIGIKRLRIDPTLQTCVDCAQ